jgi:hypothetical protein
VAARWTANDVLALAPDAASQRAAAGLARPACWSDVGTAGDLVWGLCAGSGRQPYQTIIDLTGPAYRCSCPSRKFPCKHALALLLTWSGGAVPEQGEAAGFAIAWQASRQARAAGRIATDGKPKDLAAAARRAEQRGRRVAAGLADLQVWLGDQIRAGLTAARAGGYGHAEAIAARMVDAQAPGVASALRRLSPIPMSGDGWPGRLLAEYGLLHLLARAHQQLGTLPAPLAAVVRSRVGYTTSREDVLATPPVSDRWHVLAVRDVLDGAIPARRVWLRGEQTGRFALLLSFAPAGNFGGSIEAALIPGLELQADLHFYPGQPGLRAVIGTRCGGPATAGRPASPGDVTGLLTAWSAALEQDPWLTEWPVLLAGVPVPGEPGWQLVDSSGRALPLLGQESRWPLLAVSGGHPVCLAGEWSPAGLIALTVWHGDQAVRL